MVQQHLEDSAVLRTTRSVLVRAPHVRLHHLRRLDDRLAAHLDGLAIAGDSGWQHCEAALATPGAGELFAAGVMALTARHAARIDKLLAVAEAVPESQRGLLSAFGWVPGQLLRGVTQPLLASPSAFRRRAGLSACAMHRVDPGAPLAAAATDADAALRAHGLRLSGELGRKDLLPFCIDALADKDPACRFHAARAAALLGERERCVAVLQALASSAGPQRAPALLLWLKLVPADTTRALLAPLARNPLDARLLVQATGISGDAHYVPWLIKQMADPKLARLAGESFSLLTGLDLAYLDLDGQAPEGAEGAEGGPNDDPLDDHVALDDDESLPWPDPAKLGAWWQENAARFSPSTRYFMGEPVSVAHCRVVLNTGFQRQRFAAVEHLGLLQPGAALFNPAAPAARQSAALGV